MQKSFRHGYALDRIYIFEIVELVFLEQVKDLTIIRNLLLITKSTLDFPFFYGASRVPSYVIQRMITDFMNILCIFHAKVAQLPREKRPTFAQQHVNSVKSSRIEAGSGNRQSPVDPG